MKKIVKVLFILTILLVKTNTVAAYSLLGAIDTVSQATTPYVKSGDATLSSVRVDGAVVIVANTMSHTTLKSYVDVVVVTTNSKATAQVTNVPSLVIGENIITIKVTAENGTVKNYQLLVTREKELSANVNILITIDNKTVVFNNYISDIININSNINKLNILYKLEDSNATVSIAGNQNLKTGTNDILVKVTAENGTIATYTIKINKAAGSYLAIIIGTVILAGGVAGTFLIINKRNHKK